MSTRVLVVGEGAHELGDKQTTGALLILINRMLLNAGLTECSLESREVRSFKPRVHGKGDGLQMKLIQILLEARKEGYEAVCVLYDCDDDSRRHRSAERAQASDRVTLPRAFGIAVKSFDAWFLADQQALSQVLKTTIHLQPAPEASRDPKSDMQLLMNTHNYRDSQRQFYADIAKVMDLSQVRERCPQGFACFQDRVQALCAQLRAEQG